MKNLIKKMALLMSVVAVVILVCACTAKTDDNETEDTEIKTEKNSVDVNHESDNVDYPEKAYGKFYFGMTEKEAYDVANGMVQGIDGEFGFSIFDEDGVFADEDSAMTGDINFERIMLDFSNDSLYSIDLSTGYNVNYDQVKAMVENLSGIFGDDYNKYTDSYIWDEDHYGRKVYLFTEEKDNGLWYCSLTISNAKYEQNDEKENDIMTTEKAYGKFNFGMAMDEAIEVIDGEYEVFSENVIEMNDVENVFENEDRDITGDFNCENMSLWFGENDKLYKVHMSTESMTAEETEEFFDNLVLCYGEDYDYFDGLDSYVWHISENISVHCGVMEGLYFDDDGMDETLFCYLDIVCI